MSTVPHDEESEEEVSSPKRMRSESDEETSTVSNSSLTKRAMMKTTLAYLMNREMNYIDINYRY